MICINKKITAIIVISIIILATSLVTAGETNTNDKILENNEKLIENRKAVVVGIADYPGTVNDLQYTDDDARGIKETLISGGWLEDDITLLIDDQGTKSTIVNKLNNMASGTGPDSISLFFFSGHGTQTYQGEAICCYDNDLYDSELNGILDNFQGRVVVIIDACHSGGMAPDGGTIDVELFVKNFIETIGNENRVILMACAADEYSYETSELKSGVFSYFVIKGLQGYADQSPYGNGDGVITAEETFAYAEPKTTNYMNTQHPQLYDGYPSIDVPVIGGVVIDGVKVTINMYKIKKQDDIEWLGGEAEWYYTLRVFSQYVSFTTTKSDGTNDEWIPNEDHEVEVIDSTVDLQIKLMEEDFSILEGFNILHTSSPIIKRSFTHVISRRSFLIRRAHFSRLLEIVEFLASRMLQILVLLRFFIFLPLSRYSE